MSSIVMSTLTSFGSKAFTMKLRSVASYIAGCRVYSIVDPAKILYQLCLQFRHRLIPFYKPYIRDLFILHF